MEKYRKQLFDISELKKGCGYGGFGSPVSKLLLERAERMADAFNVKPDIRATIEGEICLDYITDDINLEISVENNGILGFVTKNDIDVSEFTFDTTFDTEESAINFWNIFITEN